MEVATRLLEGVGVGLLIWAAAMLWLYRATPMELGNGVRVIIMFSLVLTACAISYVIGWQHGHHSGSEVNRQLEAALRRVVRSELRNPQTEPAAVPDSDTQP